VTLEATTTQAALLLPTGLGTDSGAGGPWLRRLALAALAFLVYPALDLAGGSVSVARAVPAGSATVVVVAAYVWVTWRPSRTARQTSTALAVMVILGVVVPAVWGPTWLGLLLYAAIAGAMCLAGPGGPATAVGLAATTAVVGAAIGAGSGLVLSLSLVTGLAGLAAFGYARLVQLNQALQAARAEAARLASAEERLRLARDLHDAVKQQLFVASMELGAARAVLGADAGRTAVHLDEAEAAIGQARGELAGMIDHMRPPAAGFCLAAALRSHLTAWSARHLTAAQFSEWGSGCCPPQVNEALLRGAQEALTNVARHARAGTVRVELAYDGDEVTLTVADNGDGFTPTDAAGHGLAIMSERLAAAGGTAAIRNTPDTGTKIILMWPASAESNCR